MASTLTRRIFVTTQFEAYHYWGDAPDSVHFLRNEHRHMFHVKVTIMVNHSDRDIEFIIFKRELTTFLSNHFDGQHLNQMSCEMMAEDIHAHLLGRGYKDPMTIEVSEDGENGAVMTWE